MKDDSGPSKTAEGVAAMRWAATRDPDPALRGPDVLAGRFLGLPYRVLAGPLRALSMWAYGRILPGMYAWICARTRHYDHVFRAAIDDGIDQIVLLGAGYDTRALRFEDELREHSVTVFELDHPATQGRKRRLLAGEATSHIRFEAVDFNRASLGELLDGAGLEIGRPALFLWEGVTMYLDAETIDATLSFVANEAARGSRLAFDFCARSMVDGDSHHVGAAETQRFLARTGELLTWGIEPEDLPAFVTERGLSLVQQYTAAEAADVYLKRSDGTTLSPITGFNNLAVVERPSE